GSQDAHPHEFWPAFYWTEKELTHKPIWQGSNAIAQALFGEAKWFAMQQNLAKAPAAGTEPEAPSTVELKDVAIMRPDGKRDIKDVAWFNTARAKLLN